MKKSSEAKPREGGAGKRKKKREAEAATLFSGAATDLFYLLMRTCSGETRPETWHPTRGHVKK
jgi:hypothetical protein